jgi:hypothetical protein
MTELDNTVKKQEESIIILKEQIDLMQKKLDELEKKITQNEV